MVRLGRMLLFFALLCVQGLYGVERIVVSSQSNKLQDKKKAKKFDTKRLIKQLALLSGSTVAVWYLYSWLNTQSDLDEGEKKQYELKLTKLGEEVQNNTGLSGDCISIIHDYLQT